MVCVGFSPGIPVSSHCPKETMRFRLTGDSQLTTGVSVSMCGPVMEWRDG